MIGVEKIAEEGAGVTGCPRYRLSGEGEGGGGCPLLLPVAAAGGSETHLRDSVEALLECRAFLWDVLTDGGWTGCARERLRELTAVYGAARVGEAFEE